MDFDHTTPLEATLLTIQVNEFVRELHSLLGKTCLHVTDARQLQKYLIHAKLLRGNPLAMRVIHLFRKATRSKQIAKDLVIYVRYAPACSRDAVLLGFMLLATQIIGLLETHRS